MTDGQTKLRDQIHVSIGSGTKKFVLNLARVEFVDSYGIGELVRCYSAVRRAGGETKLAGVNQKVLDALAISRLNAFFEMYAGEDAALGHSGRRD